MILPRFHYVTQDEETGNASVYLTDIRNDDVRLRAEVIGGVAERIVVHGNGWCQPVETARW